MNANLSTSSMAISNEHPSEKLETAAATAGSSNSETAAAATTAAAVVRFGDVVVRQFPIKLGDCSHRTSVLSSSGGVPIALDYDGYRNGFRFATHSKITMSVDSYESLKRPRRTATKCASPRPQPIDRETRERMLLARGYAAKQIADAERRCWADKRQQRRSKKNSLRSCCEEGWKMDGLSMPTAQGPEVEQKKDRGMPHLSHHHTNTFGIRRTACNPNNSDVPGVASAGFFSLRRFAAPAVLSVCM